MCIIRKESITIWDQNKKEQEIENYIKYIEKTVAFIPSL